MSGKGDILVVDDMGEFLELVAGVLTSADYQVRAVNSGERAVAAAAACAPDLILLDIRMPDMDGFEVVRRLKAQERTCDIPIILVSGASEVKQRVEGLRLGAVDFISKPFQNEELLARVDTQRELRRLRVEHEHQEVDLRMANDRLQAETEKIKSSEREAQRLLADQKRAELRLTAALVEAQRFRAALDEVPVYVYMKDAQSRYSYANRLTLELFGRSAEDLAGSEDSLFFPPATARRLREIDARVFLGEQTAEEVDVADAVGGRRIFWEVKTPMYSISDGKAISGLLGISTDITERKKAERFKSFTVRILDKLNEQTTGNDLIKVLLVEIKKFTGIEAVGVRLRQGEDFPYYETRGFSDEFVKAERFLCTRDEAGVIVRDVNGKSFLECMCGNIVCGRFDPSLPFFTPKGSFWSNCTTCLLATTTESERQTRTRNRCNSEGYETVGLIPLKSGKEIIGLLQLNDRRPGQLSVELVTYLEDLGASIGIAVQRIRADEDKRLVNVQLLQAQKLESIGQLAAGIAHEINTPTQFIGDNVHFLKDACGELLKLVESARKALPRDGVVDGAMFADFERVARECDLEFLEVEIPKAIGQTLEGVERVAKIVRAMRDFSHPGGSEKTQVDLNKAIETTVTVARNEWKYVADTRLELAPELPSVTCFPGEINQVLLNLVVNAAHAIKAAGAGDGGGKGVITISTRLDGDMVEIRVGDTGTGIAEEHRHRIFDPFFTTKELGKGTGQGLTLAHQVIVKKHGGTLRFETEVGKGTTFVIRLPLESASDACENL